jgi:2-amino-4-hydroxy-6-hydroxymethyldihydropteridine diphosphokinase
MNVGIALGSNLGDRLAQLRSARQFLGSLSPVLLASPVFETEPVGCVAGTPAFLNAVVEIESTGTARGLLRQLLTFEAAQGRDRSTGVNASRTIDLDLLYFGDAQITEPDLILPHPRIAGRRFVLAPLATLRADLVLPGMTRTIRQLLQELPGTGAEVRVFCDKW